MTASSLYKILDSFSTYTEGTRLTVDGKKVKSVTVEFEYGGLEDYHVTAVDIHTAKDEVCAA